MSSVLFLVFVAFSEPRPLDAFRANFAAIRAGLDYTYEKGSVDASAVDTPRFWEGGPPVIERSRQVLEGRWATDGVSEYFLVNPRAWGAAPVVRPDEGSLVPLRANEFTAEILVRDRIMAWHDGRTDRVHVAIADRPARVQTGIGPFYWFGPQPFPRKVEVTFESAAPVVRDADWDGHRLEVETYLRRYPGIGWYRMEVGYDPAIGYLPRVIKTVGKDEGQAPTFQDLYVVDARPCAAGGFIPTEWYELTYGGPGPEDPAAYGLETPMNPRSRVTLGHFLIGAIEDDVGPLALERLDKVVALSAVGGEVPLPRGGQALTIDRIRSLLGNRLDEAASRPLGSLDQLELDRYQERPARSWTVPAAVIGFVILASLTALYIRKKRALLLMTAVVAQSGCAADDGAAVPQLTVECLQPVVLFERPDARVAFEIANEGGATFVTRSADGGCACRRFEPGTFPCG